MKRSDQPSSRLTTLLSEGRSILKPIAPKAPSVTEDKCKEGEHMTFGVCRPTGKMGEKDHERVAGEHDKKAEHHGKRSDDHYYKASEAGAEYAKAKSAKNTDAMVKAQKAHDHHMERAKLHHKLSGAHKEMAHGHRAAAHGVKDAPVAPKELRDLSDVD